MQKWLWLFHRCTDFDEFWYIYYTFETVIENSGGLVEELIQQKIINYRHVQASVFFCSNMKLTNKLTVKSQTCTIRKMDNDHSLPSCYSTFIQGIVNPIQARFTTDHISKGSGFISHVVSMSAYLNIYL